MRDAILRFNPEAKTSIKWQCVPEHLDLKGQRKMIVRSVPDTCSNAYLEGWVNVMEHYEETIDMHFAQLEMIFNIMNSVRVKS